MAKLPPQFAQGIGNLLTAENVKKYIAIINSMTFEERHNHNILKSSRKRRIADGSGTKVQDVNQLLKQFDQLSMFAKQFGKNSNNNANVMSLMGNLKKLF